MFLADKYKSKNIFYYQVTFMYMNSSLFEFNNKMSSVAMTILNSFESSGISVNYLRCWKEPYHVTHMNNPFHELVASTYRETRSEYGFNADMHISYIQFTLDLFIIPYK